MLAFFEAFRAWDKLIAFRLLRIFSSPETKLLSKKYPPPPQMPPVSLRGFPAFFSSRYLDSPSCLRTSLCFTLVSYCRARFRCVGLFVYFPGKDVRVWRESALFVCFLMSFLLLCLVAYLDPLFMPFLKAVVFLVLTHNSFLLPSPPKFRRVYAPPWVAVFFFFSYMGKLFFSFCQRSCLQEVMP